MPLPRTLAVIMDPIASIKPYKDTTLALLLAAQAHGYQLFYAEPRHLTLRGREAYAVLTPLQVFDDTERWFELGEGQARPLAA